MLGHRVGRECIDTQMINRRLINYIEKFFIKLLSKSNANISTVLKTMEGYFMAI